MNSIFPSFIWRQFLIFTTPRPILIISFVTLLNTRMLHLLISHWKLGYFSKNVISASLAPLVRWRGSLKRRGFTWWWCGASPTTSTSTTPTLPSALYSSPPSSQGTCFLTGISHTCFTPSIRASDLRSFTTPMSLLVALLQLKARQVPCEIILGP